MARSFVANEAAALSISKLAIRLPAHQHLSATHYGEENCMNAVATRIALLTVAIAASAVAQSTVRAALQPALER